MALQKLKTEGTLSDKAYLSLKDNILSLDLKPGEVLLEDRLSEMLGISRTPIREALKKLTYEGLITTSNGKGTYVTELTTDQFKNIYVIRDSLEALSVRLACIHRSAEDMKSLRKMVAEQIEIIRKPKLDDRYYLEVDRKIHMRIAKCSRNDMLEKYLVQINESYKRYLYFTNFEKRAEGVTDEHSRIVDAIANNDPEAAESIMLTHLKGVNESIHLALVNAGKI